MYIIHWQGWFRYGGGDGVWEVPQGAFVDYVYIALSLPSASSVPLARWIFLL